MLAHCWSRASVFANASARSFSRRGTCSTHTAPAWANHALAITIRWRSAGKCKVFLPWKASATSSESPRTVADGRSDSATHWHAAANAVNSATLLDADPRYPYPPKTTRCDNPVVGKHLGWNTQLQAEILLLSTICIPISISLFSLRYKTITISALRALLILGGSFVCTPTAYRT